ncbi:MAG: hypothetical protein FWD35_00480, partial [Oscillospiraceae bacterium]|nr:hypothetical protein [Oscillospiraceae bacterium]
WLACQGIDLTACNLSTLERLDKFGYALIFDEFGNGRADKIQLCIHSVLAEASKAQKANILMVCSETLMQVWYSLLISEIGADFKFISADGNSVAFYSDGTSNLYIVAEEKLKASGGIEGGFLKDAGVTWDLMIIDAVLAVGGADWAGYYNNCKNKAKKLLVFAPCPFPYDIDISSSFSVLKDMLKSFVKDEERKGQIAELKIDENIVAFNRDTPITRYYSSTMLKEQGPNVVVCEYEINKELFNSSNKLLDIQTGLPYYSYGGNVFEEFNTDLRHKYMRQLYDKGDVEKLRKADAKLDMFLTKLDTVLKNDGNNAVIYFTSHDTLGYVRKVLNVIYSQFAKDNKIITRTDTVLDRRHLKLRFSAEGADVARITLATDLMGDHYDGMGKSTHVFNYEYPENPAELERRYFRTARIGQGLYVPDEFIIFVDKSSKFDGRVLSKVMFGGICGSVKVKIPSQNLLFWVPEAQKYIAEVIADLKSVIYNSRGATTEHARNYCVQYNIADRGLVPTAGKAARHAEEALNKLVGFFDVGRFMPVDGEPVDKKILTEKIRESLVEFKSGYVYYEETGNVKPKVIKETTMNDSCAVIKSYDTHDIVKGVAAAKSELEKMVGKAAKGKYPVVRGAVAKLPEGLKTPILYNIWKYCKVEKGYKKSLKEFIEQYNKGTI